MSEINIDTQDLAEILTWLDSWPNGITVVKVENKDGDALHFTWSDELDRATLTEAL